MKSNKRTTALVFSLLLFFAAGDAAAISVRSVSLAEMVSLSDRVFLGRVVKITDTVDSRLNLKVGVYTFVVLEGLKGAGTGETVEIRQAGSTVGGYSSVPGLPVYRKGQVLLLFLHGDSRFGLTSPVGLAQGVFREVGLQGGGKGYINGVENRNLDLESQPAYKTISPVPAESVSANYSSDLPLTIARLKTFIKEVEEKRSDLK